MSPTLEEAISHVVARARRREAARGGAVATVTRCECCGAAREPGRALCHSCEETRDHLFNQLRQVIS